MALTPTDRGDNTVTPSARAEDYKPDQLIAGELKRVTATGLISGNAALKRGAVLGQNTSGNYILCAVGAAGGADVPSAILADDCDPTSGDVLAPIYLTGEFNSRALSFGTGKYAANVTAQLRDAGIFIKDTVSASDPS